jgi:hypothetical protein
MLVVPYEASVPAFQGIDVLVQWVSDGLMSDSSFT